MRRLQHISAVTVLILLTMTACGDQDQPVNDGLPNQRVSETPATAPADPAKKADVTGPEPSESEDASETDSFSIEYALAQLPQSPSPYDGRPGYTVADIEQAFDWLGPVEDVWMPENVTVAPDVGRWFSAANMTGSKPPSGEHNQRTPDFILNVLEMWFGDEERAGFDLGLPVRETKFVAQGHSGGVMQLYAQFQPGYTLPSVLEDQGEGLYLIPASAGTLFRNSEGNEWRLGTRDHEVLIDRSTGEVRKWTLGDTSGSLREDTVLMETATALDDLGIAVAHIYPSPRQTVIDDLRESREPDRDAKFDELRSQIRLTIPCEAAAIGWFDEAGEPRELILYHFGNAGTASEALGQVEAAWSDQQNPVIGSNIRVRDIRQEGSIVYVVPEDQTENGSLAHVLTRMAERGDVPFTCGAINPF